MSRVQKLIAAAARAQAHTPTHFTMRVASTTVKTNYGYVLLGPSTRGVVRSQRLCSKMLSRDIVDCGGCNRGRVPQRDPKTRRRTGNPANWPKHADCNGTGLRINWRYGRCGSASSRIS